MAALLAAALVILAGCGTEPATSTGPTNGAGPTTSTGPTNGAEGEASGPGPTTTVTEVLVPTLDGGTIGLWSVREPVVFWFWAPWCTKCRSDAPAVKAAAEAHPDVTFIGVAGLDAKPAMQEFVRDTGLGGITHVADEEGTVWTSLGGSQQSTFVFRKKDGTTDKAPGPLGRDGLESWIRHLKAG